MKRLSKPKLKDILQPLSMKTLNKTYTRNAFTEGDGKIS